ncbi:MAG: alpha-amylase family glycosyl hydrolase, partial [Caldilineaceae bacterium]
ATRLYDRLHAGQATAVRGHLCAGLDFQDHLARFLENHDEPRAVTAFPPDQGEAAAVVTYLTPGLRFFHQGQREGKSVRIPTHLRRGPTEPINQRTARFHDHLFALLRSPVLREGDWRLLETRPAWETNPTHANFVAFGWTGPTGDRLLVVVNYADHAGQCFLALAWDDLAEQQWRLVDQLGSAAYDRSGSDLAAGGLYLDMPAWGYHAFALTPTRIAESLI